jgi:hypothetical protein
MGILSVANPIEIIRKNSKQRVNISVVDSSTGNEEDATALTLQVTDLADTIMYSEDFFAAVTHRIIKPSGTIGQYYIVWGDGGAAPADPVGETDTPQDLLFNWSVIATTGSEEVNTTQVVKVVSASTLSLLPYFSLLIDKAVKLVDGSQQVFLGYTQAQLIQYLEGGLQTINQYQPYGFFTFETFPISQFRQILLESALLVGVMSQTLFAVDTDVPSYSDQGESFTINHQAPLAQFLNNLAQKLDKSIPAFKLHFVSTGTVKTEMGPSYRLQSVLSASPSGSLFRNLVFRP